MKVIKTAILAAALSAGAAEAQSIPVGASYSDALDQLNSQDRAPVRGADESAVEEGLSTTQRRTTDFNKRVGKRTGRETTRPARIGVTNR